MLPEKDRNGAHITGFPNPVGCIAISTVGNLPYSAREEDIADFFGQVGSVVNVRIVFDRETGRPRGFGFCEFETEDAAERAVGSMNNADFMGRQIRVDRANSR